jgi:hypothetical protein
VIAGPWRAPDARATVTSQGVDCGQIVLAFGETPGSETMSIIQKVMPAIILWAVLLSAVGVMYGGMAMAVKGM